MVGLFSHNMLVRDASGSVISATLSYNNYNGATSTSTFTFPTNTLTVLGGIPSSITWSYVDISNGVWSFVSGQGTVNIVPRVSSTLVGGIASATLECTYIVNGTSYTLTCYLSYERL